MPSAMITRNIGVINRPEPFSFTHSFKPSQVSVNFRCFWANRTTPFSPSSSWSVSRTSLIAVYTRNAPKR